jgi:hypothetical protein
MTPAPLPPWPDKPASVDHTNAEYAWAMRCYERARAEAAMARLVVAVEALSDTVAQCVECNGQGQFRSPVNPSFLNDCDACADARRSLSLIGDLPPSSQERG